MIYHGKKKTPGSLLTNGPVADAARPLVLTIAVQAARGCQRPPTGSGQSESNKQNGQLCVDNW